MGGNSVCYSVKIFGLFVEANILLDRKLYYGHHPIYPPDENHLVSGFAVDAPEQSGNGAFNAGAEPVKDQVLRGQGRHRGGDPAAVQTGGLPSFIGDGSDVYPVGAADRSNWCGAGAFGGAGERALLLSLPSGRDNAVHASGGGIVGADAGLGAEPSEPSSAGAEQGGSVDDQRAVHWYLPGTGRICSGRGGLLLDCQQSFDHRPAADSERSNEAREARRLQGAGKKPAGARGDGFPVRSYLQGGQAPGEGGLQAVFLHCQQASGLLFGEERLLSKLPRCDCGAFDTFQSGNPLCDQ